jgi:hypothetical protein
MSDPRFVLAVIALTLGAVFLIVGWPGVLAIGLFVIAGVLTLLKVLDWLTLGGKP